MKERRQTLGKTRSDCHQPGIDGIRPLASTVLRERVAIQCGRNGNPRVRDALRVHPGDQRLRVVEFSRGHLCAIDFKQARVRPGNTRKAVHVAVAQWNDVRMHVQVNRRSR